STVCFMDNADRNTWIACDADAPSLYGWKIDARYTNIIGGRVFCNTYNEANTVTGVKCVKSDPAATITGLAFFGVAGHEMLTDISTPHYGSTFMGITRAGVSNPLTTSPNYADRWNLRDSLAITQETANAISVLNTLRVNAQ